MSGHSRHIVVVDDNYDNRVLLKARLLRRGYRVDDYPSGEDFLRSLQGGELAELVLLDLMMPGMSGLEVIKKLREQPGTNLTPIIVVSAAGEDSMVVEALRAGANDFVTKPVNFEILLARIETHLRMRDALETIRAQRDMLEALALFDPLTGVYNRRAFEARLEDEMRRCRRSQRPLSLVFFDLDHFKIVNDRYGHVVGDDVLRWFAQKLQGLVRSFDVVARYGGEEFCVILPETSGEQAHRAAERIREVVASEPYTANDLVLNVTVSGGVAESHDQKDLAANLIQHADEALYEAKRLGRNRVVLFADALGLSDPGDHRVEVDQQNKA
ncbi:MAG: diguanylate cyclase [Candidatus Sumerlaeaceae bacterium]|nr:diguanylate cyclase [Candidatus Sumerlaeaceae bacterium]